MFKKIFHKIVKNMANLAKATDKGSKNAADAYEDKRVQVAIDIAKDASEIAK